MMVWAVVMLPALSLVLAELLTRRSELTGRICLAGVSLALTLAAALVVRALIGPPATSVAGPLSLTAGRLSAAMLVLVLGVSALVQAFALRNLSGASEQPRLIRTTALVTSAVALTVTAAHLVLLLLGWELTTLGLLAVVGQRRELPLAREGLRRGARALLAGDAALLLAGALIWRSAGDASLSHLHRVALALGHARLPMPLFALPAAPCVAVLLTLAAAARAAQLPGQSWLAATVTTPTPASAMLHAGLVNAGGFLLVRLAPVFADGPAGPALAVTIGLLTALYASTLSLTRPDVKGGLAQSTSAQMGFMLMACGLGAYAAAIAHLIGHGLYKASAFLAADGAVAAHTAKRAGPRPEPGAGPAPAVLAAVASVCAAAMLAALASFARPALSEPGAVVPLCFAWAAAVTVSASLLRRALLPVTVVLAMGALVLTAYCGLLAALSAYLRLPDPGSHTLPLVFTLPAIAAAFLALQALLSPARGIGRVLEPRLYPRLLELGGVCVRPLPSRGAARTLLRRPAEQPARLAEQGAAA